MLLANNLSFKRGRREIFRDLNISLSPKKIIHLKSSDFNEVISLNHFSPGIYTLKITSKSTFYSDKIIVN